MATKSRRTYGSLIERLISNPWEFEFFQAVRLLEQYAAEQMLEHGGGHVHAVGNDERPDEELLRFRALASHTFPPAEIASIRPLPAVEPQSAHVSRFEMVVPFFGLTGPAGVLPQHYTQLVIDRLRLKDYALRDFLDVFNHRMLSLFFRAWEKYRFHAGYVKKSWQVRTAELKGAVREDERIELFQHCVFSLIGLGTRGLLSRLEPSDEAFLFYSGHFAHQPRNAISLEMMLADFLELPARVEQFRGQWLYLSPPDQTSLPSPHAPNGLNASLGMDTVVGERVWSVQDKFRIQLGPLDYASFCRLMPTGDRLRPLAQLTRMYVGPELDFDVQPVLLAAEVPSTRFGADGRFVPRLGWNTWLLTRPATRDAGDAVFVDEGHPGRQRVLFEPGCDVIVAS